MNISCRWSFVGGRVEPPDSFYKLFHANIRLTTEHWSVDGVVVGSSVAGGQQSVAA
ncbi:MAG TPA: hypothetical protein VJV05_02345 [Pyrinomonadaceae bacterium]|nr:hypothetical protein [Pyrinomonadaceae bacterium]